MMETCTGTRTKGCCKWHLCDSDVYLQSSSSSSSRNFVSNSVCFLFWGGIPMGFAWRQVCFPTSLT
jgi:hypothetical protein